MNSSLKKVFNNSIFFSIGVIASKAIGLLMLPIYTNFLSDESYGMATTVTSFVTTFCVVITLSLRSALMRFYSKYEDETERRRFVGSIVSTVIVNGIIIVGICILLKDWLIKLFFDGISFIPLVLLGLFALLFDAVYVTYQSVLQAKQNGKAYTLNSALYLLTNAAFNILFIVVLRLDAVSMVLSLLCTNVLFTGYSIVRLLQKKEMILCLDKKYIIPSLKYSLPILPHDLSNNISNYLSKVLLNNIISYASSGLFTVATQITSIMNLVQSSINLAFRPWFNEQITSEDGRRNIKRFSVFVFSVYGFVSIAIAYFSQEILYLIAAPEYRSAWKVIPLLLMALVVSFIYYIHVLSVMYNLKTSKFVFICSLSGCVANLIFSWLLIPHFEILGAGLAKLLSQIVLSTVTVIMAWKAERIDFGLKSMICQLIFIAVMMAGGLFFSYKYDMYGFNWLNIAYKLLLLGVSGVILFWNQRKQIKTVFQQLQKNKMGGKK